MSQELPAKFSVIIVGASVYGIAAALACQDLAAEQQLDLDISLFDREAMVAAAWARMPPLPIRSNVSNSSLMVSGLTLKDYYRSLPPGELPPNDPGSLDFGKLQIPLRDIQRYLHWVCECRRLEPQLSTEVTDIEGDDTRLRIGLQNEKQSWQQTADCVILATGLARRAYVPEIFHPFWQRSRYLKNQAVSHTAEWIDYDRLRGRVCVVGAGQSGAEAVWLALQAGCDVLQLARSGLRYNLHPLPNNIWNNYSNPILQRFFRWLWRGASTSKSQKGLHERARLHLSHILYTAMTRSNATPNYRPPTGSSYKVIEGRDNARITAVAYDEQADQVTLHFSGGQKELFDYIILATGYGPVTMNPLIDRMVEHSLLQIDPKFPNSILVDHSARSVSHPRVFVTGAMIGRSLGPFLQFIRGTYMVQAMLREGILDIMLPDRTVT